MNHTDKRPIGDVTFGDSATRVGVLREVTAVALQYGEAFFSDSPMGHFTKWLQSQVLLAENDADEPTSILGAEQKP